MTHETHRTGGTLSRRGFLRQSAGLGASFALAHAAVRGARADNQIELGLVGCGTRGRWIAQGFEAHGGYRITAVADYFEEEANAAGDALGVAENRRFSGLRGYERLLESGVGAVALETPPYCFPDHVEAAVDAGCHVFLAKPVAVDVPGTKRIEAAGQRAGENGQVFLVDFQMPTHPYIQEAVRRVHDGALEEIALVSSEYTDEGFRDPPLEDTIEGRLRNLVWVNDNNLGGGYFVNAGIHALDAALWVIGRRPVRAMGAARRDPHGDSDDGFSLTYEFENGLVLNHRGEHIRNSHGFNCNVTVYGREAYMVTGYTGETAIHGQESARYEGGAAGDLYHDGAERNIAAFHQAVLEGDTSNPTLAPSIASNYAAILGRDAIIKGEPLTWDAMLAEEKALDVNLSEMRE